MTQSKHYTDGSKIIFCHNLADVEKAFAAGAIAHLLSGDILVEIAGSKSVTLWVSDGATAVVKAYDSAKVTMCAFDKARASAWAHCNVKPGVRVFEGTKVIVWAYDNAKADVEASGNATATVWAFDSADVAVAAYNNAKANVEARGNAKVTVRAYGNATATVWAYDNAVANVAWLSSATPSPETAAHITYKTASGDKADANIKEVAAFVKRERASFNMDTWHSDERDLGGDFPCGTTHCIAGAAIFLKGDEGRKMEEMFGSQVAGAIILGKEAAEYFYASDKNALIFLSSKLGEPIE